MRCLMMIRVPIRRQFSWECSWDSHFHHSWRFGVGRTAAAFWRCVWIRLRDRGQFVVSHNGRCYDESLNIHRSEALAEPRKVLHGWWVRYNEMGPHISLRYRAPVVQAAEQLGLGTSLSTAEHGFLNVAIRPQTG